MLGIITHRRWRGRDYLLSPVIDFLMVGGLGLLIAAAFLFLFPVRPIYADAHSQSMLLTALFLYSTTYINYPHFAYSYQLAYRKMDERLRGRDFSPGVRWRYRFALVGFPVLFVGYCVYMSQMPVAQGRHSLGLLVNLMFATVGWHYGKQCFGIMITLSALKKIYFKAWERRLMLVAVILVWLVSWLGKNLHPFQKAYFGLYYESFHLHQYFPSMPMQIVQYWRQMAIYATLALGGAVLLMLLVKALRERQRPSFTAMAGFFSLYPFILISWYVGALWVWIVPALHSLQYLTFIYGYKRNEYDIRTHLLPTESASPTRVRRTILGFLFAGILLGMLQFEWLPRLLDHVVPLEDKLYLPTFFFALFNVFINIHHYFIDNVIWRKENPEVKRYLIERV